ncbi:hypothetical protein [Aquiflexum sp.]
MKSSLSRADRHVENDTQWNAPIAFGVTLLDSPDPPRRTGQAMWP